MQGIQVTEFTESVQMQVPRKQALVLIGSSMARSGTPNPGNHVSETSGDTNKAAELPGKVERPLLARRQSA